MCPLNPIVWYYVWYYVVIIRTYVIHLLGTYVTILCNWLILWQNTLYLYLGRLRMCLNTSKNHVSRSNVEAFKSVQENKLKVQSYWSSTASMCWGSRKLFSPCARHLLDTSYLSRFKNFKILIWFSCNPWMCLWAIFSPNPRHIKRIVLRAVKRSQVAQALTKLCSSKLWLETKFLP